MDKLGTIWEFKTKSLIISVVALVEDDLDLSFDDTGEVAKKLSTGEYVAFCAKASVYDMVTGDTLASDYLGDCIYADISDFKDNLGIANTKYGSYFSGMVKTVCKEARKAIKIRANHYRSLTSAY